MFSLCLIYLDKEDIDVVWSTTGTIYRSFTMCCFSFVKVPLKYSWSWPGRFREVFKAKQKVGHLLLLRASGELKGRMQF